MALKDLLKENGLKIFTGKIVKQTKNSTYIKDERFDDTHEISNKSLLIKKSKQENSNNSYI